MTKTTLSEWDRTVAPHLRQLEDRSKWISIHAHGVFAAGMALMMRPAWPTKADAELERTEHDLMAALDIVRGVRAKYAALPVIVEAA